MKLSQFKELIKEAVREVVKEELKDIRQVLLENKQVSLPFSQTAGIKNPPTTTTTNHNGKRTNVQFKSTGDPLIDLLNETKFNTSNEDWQNFGGFNSGQAQGYSSPDNMNSFHTTGTVIDMLNNTPKSSDINQINIDVVPDFSKLMGTMKEQGQI